MEVIKSKTAQKINYFDLFDFIEKIKISPIVLEHIKDTNENFYEYFKKLSKFDDKFVLYFLVSLARDEINNNQKVENHRIKEFDFSISNLFFDGPIMSHNRLHNIHKFVMQDEENNNNIGAYRDFPVRVSKIIDNKEEIYWYGVNHEDIKQFMDKFIEVYRSKNTSILDSDPFIKSSLMHLLLVKIQPYYDGNRRTARILHNIKFTEIINEMYDMDLRISPINISESIRLNILSYVKALNNTYFDLEHNNNEIINYWFNLMLNLYDEQLYRNKHIIDNIDKNVEKILEIKDFTDPEIIKEIENIDNNVNKVIEIRNKMNNNTRNEVDKMKIRKR